jgi:hypothetical protein
MKRLLATMMASALVCVVAACGSLDVSQDTYISQLQPDRNFAGDETLRVGERQRNAALLRFVPPDPDDVPDNVVITSADRLCCWWQRG